MYLEAGGPDVVGAVGHVELEHDPPLELGLVPHTLLTPVSSVSLLHHLLVTLLPVGGHVPAGLVQSLVLAGNEEILLITCRYSCQNNC